MEILCNDPSFPSSSKIRFLTFGPNAPGGPPRFDFHYDYERPFAEFAAEAGKTRQLSAVFIFLPEYHAIPPGIEEAELPLAAFVSDWNLRFHALEKNLFRFDRVVTDAGGCEALSALGIRNLLHWNMYGFDPSAFGAEQEKERPWDVLFVGNLSPVIQGERCRFLRRLANLSPNLKVRIDTHLFGKAYADALRSAKIVFNRSIRGEANKRVFESLAAGSLVFLEKENREIRDFLTEGEECVLYGEEDMEALLQKYAVDNNARQSVVRRAAVKASRYSFPAMLDDLAEKLAATGFFEGKGHSRAFVALPEKERLIHNLANAFYGAGTPVSGALTARWMKRLDEAGATAAEAAIVLYYFYHRLDARRPNAEALKMVGRIFKKIMETGPGRHPACLNYSLLLRKMGDGEGEMALLKMWGPLLDLGVDPAELSGAVFAVAGEPFFPELNRLHFSVKSGKWSAMQSVFQNYRLTRLGELLGLAGRSLESIGALTEAVRAWPDNPSTRALLGRSLLGAGDFQAALRELRAAYDANPFLMAAWEPLLQAYSLCGGAGAGEGKAVAEEMERMRSFVGKAYGNK